jgi:hypothetical protein
MRFLIYTTASKRSTSPSRGKEPRACSIRGWMGPRSTLDAVEKKKLLSLPENKHRYPNRPVRGVVTLHEYQPMGELTFLIRIIQINSCDYGGLCEGRRTEAKCHQTLTVRCGVATRNNVHAACCRQRCFYCYCSWCYSKWPQHNQHLPGVIRAHRSTSRWVNTAVSINPSRESTFTKPGTGT